MTATPVRVQSSSSTTSCPSPSSSNRITCGARQRTACRIPSGLGYPRSTSQPGRPPAPAISPRSSTTATRSRRAASCPASARSRVVLPLDGSPTSRALRTAPSAVSSGSSPSALPGQRRGKRIHSAVTCPTVRIPPSPDTAVPAIPTRMPPATAKKPCRSSSSWAYTDSSHKRRNIRSSSAAEQRYSPGWRSSVTPLRPR